MFKSIIQKRTGHKSLEALRVYERVTPSQDKADAHILAATDSTNCNTFLPLEVSPSDSDEQFSDRLMPSIIECSPTMLFPQRDL